MKHIIKRLNKKTRKKGAIIIEFLVVFPVFMLTVWVIMQLMLFTLAVSTINQASMEGARILAQNLRGFEGQFTDKNISDAGLTKQQIKGLVINKMENVTRFNNYVLLFKDGKGTSVEPNVEIKLTRAECSTFINQQAERAICIWSDDTFGSGQEQVGVMAKSKFNVIGNFIPGAGNIMNLKGVGMSHKDLTNRFNYYK